MSRRKYCAHLTISGLLLAACGDSDSPPESGGGTYEGAAADGKIGNSDPDAEVSALNDAEWKAACLDISQATTARELAHGPCILSGILGSAVGLPCMDLYELCLSQPESTTCDEKPTDCSATLRQLDACTVSQLVWFAEQTKDVDCSSSIEAITSLDPQHETPECQAVKSLCPNFVPAGTDDGAAEDFAF